MLRSPAALLAALFVNVPQRRNSQCAAWEKEINPWNFVALPCEPQMAVDIAQMAKLEAEMYRLTSSPSDGRANSSYDGWKAVDHYGREAASGEPKDTAYDVNADELSAYKPYFFRDPTTGKIVSSNVSQPDN